MDIILTNNLKLKNIPKDLHRELIDELTLLNPKYIENVKMGRWNSGTPKILKFYRPIKPDTLIIPRGFLRRLILLCRDQKITHHIIDQRRKLPDVSYTFYGTLKPFQKIAVEAMAAKQFGTLNAPTGSGKTVMAINLIALRKQPTLIIVHTKDLAFQWIEKIETFLKIKKDHIGLIGAGEKKWGDRITVALIQSLYKCSDEAALRTGHLIVDECHRTPSRTFTEAVAAFDAFYVMGLSATPWRRDNLSQLIFWHLGDIHHQIEKADLIESGDVLEAEIIWHETDFKPHCDPVHEYSKMLSELTNDADRNQLIVTDIAKEAKTEKSGACLVISDRKKHCLNIQSLLEKNHNIAAALITGDLPQTDRRLIINRLHSGDLKVLIATGQLIGEGFDAKGLKTLFIVTPIGFSGRLIQYIGRVLRSAPGKEKARIYDYIDRHVEVLVKSAENRKKVYNR